MSITAHVFLVLSGDVASEIDRRCTKNSDVENLLSEVRSCDYALCNQCPDENSGLDSIAFTDESELSVVIATWRIHRDRDMRSV